MIKILELFGGIGSPRQALINLGIEHKSIDYVEIDENAVRSYNAMFHHLNEHKPTSVIGYNLKPDILIHGSPCQDFSRAGTRLGGKDEDKTRSSLMWETIKIIKNLGVWKPRIIIWENVKGVLDKDMIGTFEKYLIALEELGYTNNFKVLNAMDFGIPQKRERLFTISMLGGGKFDFDKLKNIPTKSIHHFLESDVEHIEKYIIKSPSMLKKINCKDTRTLTPIKDFVWTITTKQDRCPNAGIVDLGNNKYRLLTELECWRLMGFSDESFEKTAKANNLRPKFKNAQLYKQAGNSIVVPILEEIFRVILEKN